MGKWKTNEKRISQPDPTLTSIVGDWNGVEELTCQFLVVNNGNGTVLKKELVILFRDDIFI